MPAHSQIRSRPVCPAHSQMNITALMTVTVALVVAFAILALAVVAVAIVALAVVAVAIVALAVVAVATIALAVVVAVASAAIAVVVAASVALAVVLTANLSGELPRCKVGATLVLAVLVVLMAVPGLLPFVVPSSLATPTDGTAGCSLGLSISHVAPPTEVSADCNLASSVSGTMVVG